MQCPKCQTKLRDGTQFCINCGYRINTEPSVGPAKEVSVSAQSAKVKDKPVKEICIAITMSVFSILLGVLLIFAFSDSDARAMKKALQSKDINRVQALYKQTNDVKKLSSYDTALMEYINAIYKDLNNHDFEEEAIRSGAVAVTDYLKAECGSLVTQAYSDGLAQYMDNSTLSEWTRLHQLIDSKIDYCVGVMTYKGEGNFEDAIYRFTDINASDASYEKAKQYLEECISKYIEQIMSQADTYMQNDDLGGCLSLLKSAEEFLEDAGVSAEQIQNKMNEATRTYAEKYVAKAEEAFKNKDVDGAIGNMEAALELQPDNGDYQAKLENYKLYLPFKLYLESNCLSVTKDGQFYGRVYFNQNLESNDNRTMPHSFYWYQNSPGGFSSAEVINYNLEGKYDVVTGTIFLTKRDKSKHDVGYFDVYGDGALIYTSPKITLDVLPQDISFSVTGVQNLKIAFRAQGESGTSAFFGLSNLTAQKKFPE